MKNIDEEGWAGRKLPTSPEMTECSVISGRAQKSCSEQLVGLATQVKEIRFELHFLFL